MGPKLELLLQIRVHLRVMAMKGYFPELESHHQMQFSVIPRTPLFGTFLPPSVWDTVSIF